MNITVREFSNASHHAYKRAGITVTDHEGKRVVSATFNVRNGQYAILRHWDGEHGSLEGDVIVVAGDYALTTSEPSKEANDVRLV